MKARQPTRRGILGPLHLIQRELACAHFEEVDFPALGCTMEPDAQPGETFAEFGPDEGLPYQAGKQRNAEALPIKAQEKA